MICNLLNGQADLDKTRCLIGILFEISSHLAKLCIFIIKSCTVGPSWIDKSNLPQPNLSQATLP